MYSKVFKQMYEGSMFGAGLNVFAVWNYALAYSDQNGELEMNPAMVSAQLGCEHDDVVDALEFLQSEDPNSRSKAENGKRLFKIGQFKYSIVNRSKYRDIRDMDSKREYDREYQKTRYDEKRRGETRKDESRKTSCTSSQTETETEKENKNICAFDQEFDQFWAVYPKKKSKADAQKAFKKTMQKIKDVQILIDAVKKHAQTKEWKDPQYIPLAGTWLRGERWEDEIADGPREMTGEELLRWSLQ